MSHFPDVLANSIKAIRRKEPQHKQPEQQIKGINEILLKSISILEWHSAKCKCSSNDAVDYQKLFANNDGNALFLWKTFWAATLQANQPQCGNYNGSHQNMRSREQELQVSMVVQGDTARQLFSGGSGSMAKQKPLQKKTKNKKQNLQC